MQRELDGRAVLERVRGLPGGRELLDLAGAREGVELVGGAVRDIVLGATPRELDVVVADGAQELARELAARVGSVAGEPSASGADSTFHERFRTALVRWDHGRVDIATRRAESYPAPGALPEVGKGTAEQDLRRRDFTVNAIAVSLSPPDTGRTRSVEHALDDLRRRLLRVLHEQSFRDDPTRLLRLARYRARLGFEIEPHTAELAGEALAAGALRTVSGARVGAELRLALAEPDPLATLQSIDDLGLLAAIDPLVRLDRPLLERALALLPADGRPDLLALATLTLPIAGARPAGDDREGSAGVASLLDRLEFGAAERDRVTAATGTARELSERLPRRSRPSQLRTLVGAAPPEALALAGALDRRASEPARRWLGELRHVALLIDGQDLLAAGIAEGPEIGRRLDATLRARLDGELPDERDAQLQAALGMA